MSNYIGNQPSLGEFKRLDSIASSFNGSLTEFNLTYNTVGQAVGDPSQLIVSLNGIIQEPLESYTLGIGGNSIVFSSAPASGDACHIVLLGGVGQAASTVADASITTAKIADNAVDSTKLDETDLYTVAGLTTTGDITFGDGGTINLGDFSEFKIYHTSSGNSIISETGAGSLYLDAANLYLRNSTATGENYIACTSDGGVSLYYDNSPKLATSGSGVNVTGNITASSGLIGFDGGDNITFTNNSFATVNVNGVGRVTFATTHTTFNENGDDVDFRVESDTNTHALFVQGSDGNVGIGTDNPTATLHTVGTNVLFDSDTYNILEVRTDNNDDQTSTDGIVKITNGASSTTKAEFRWDESEDLVHISYGDHGRNISISSSGNVGINTGSTTPSHKLDVAGDINAQNAFRTDEALPTIRPSLLLDFANSKTLDPRITFTRASTATYYDGKTHAKAEENLLGLSEDFANGWSKTNVSVTNNDTTAPDGTTTAAKLLEQTAGGMKLQREPFTPLYSYDGDIAYSMYFKSGAGSHQYSWLSLRGENGDVFWAVFNLSTGSVTNTGSAGTASIASASMIDAGNGWYRCYIIGTYGQAYTNPIIYCGLSDGSSPSSNGYYSNGSWTQDGSYIYAWGGQVERRDFITAYTPTTYWTVTNNIPVLKTAASGIPRFHHDPVTHESKGLLIENQQTNLFSESVAQSGSWGGNFNPSAGEFVLYNYTIAPDGTKTAAKLGYNYLASAQPRLQLTNISLGSNTYTMSFYAKSGEWNYISASFYYNSYVYVTVDLSDGSVYQTNVSSNRYGVEPVGNGWYRIWLSYTSPGTLNNNPTGLWPSKTGLTAGFNTDGEDIGGVAYNGIYVWGAQMEQGVGASSYIPTNGSQVTRSGDTAHITGENFSNNINSEEFSLFVEGTEQHYLPTVSNWMIEIADNSPYYERLQIGYYEGNFAATSKRYNTTQAQFNGPQGAAFGEYLRLAIGLKLNDAAASYDGGAVETDTNCNHPIGLNRLGIGCGFRYGDQQLDGTIKKLAIWPKRLSNAQLQALTEE